MVCLCYSVKYKERPRFHCPQTALIPEPFIHTVSLPWVEFRPVSGPRHTPYSCGELTMGKPWGDAASGMVCQVECSR